MEVAITLSLGLGNLGNLREKVAPENLVTAAENYKPANARWSNSFYLIKC